MKVGFPFRSEIATPSNRGMLVSLNEVAITLGFLVAYLVGLIYVDRPHGWRYMSVFTAIFRTFISVQYQFFHSY